MSWVSELSSVYIPATTAIIPTLLLACIAIATTILGLVVKEQAGFSRVGILMIFGFCLGVTGLLGWVWAAEEYDYTVEVCAYSKIIPSDTGAQWACPQVQASNQIAWVLGVGLVIPALLFFVAPYLRLRAEHKLSSPVC